MMHTHIRTCVAGQKSRSELKYRAILLYSRSITDGDKVMLHKVHGPVANQRIGAFLYRNMPARTHQVLVMFTSVIYCYKTFTVPVNLPDVISSIGRSPSSVSNVIVHSNTRLDVVLLSTETTRIVSRFSSCRFTWNIFAINVEARLGSSAEGFQMAFFKYKYKYTG